MKATISQLWETGRELISFDGDEFERPQSFAAFSAAVINIFSHFQSPWLINIIDSNHAAELSQPPPQTFIRIFILDKQKNLCYLKNITCHKCICKTAFRPESCFFSETKNRPFLASRIFYFKTNSWRNIYV